ncbi:hypothetical protein ACVIEM_006559 [Rhizobium leguminosarum]
MSISGVTSVISSSTSDDDLWRSASGSAMTATRVSFSIPKPGSIFSVRSRNSFVNQATSRTGFTVPARIACRVPSTFSTIRSARRTPRPRFCSSSISCTTSRPTYLSIVSAAPIGSAKARLTSIGSAVRIGSIGSETRPNIWSSRRPISGPKRSVSGARGMLANSPIVWKPSVRRSLTTFPGRRSNDIGSFSTARTVSPEGTMTVSRLMTRAQAWAAPQVSAIATRGVSFFARN